MQASITHRACVVENNGIEACVEILQGGQEMGILGKTGAAWTLCHLAYDSHLKKVKKDGMHTPSPSLSPRLSGIVSDMKITGSGAFNPNPDPDAKVPSRNLLLSSSQFVPV